MGNFDLAIIGAGPAGYEAAVFAAKQGLKTALIEKSELGGTCLNNGCIPTKTLLHTADLYREMTNQADIIGLDYQALSFDMKKMQLHKQDVIQKLREGIAKLMKMHKVTIIKGCAKIVGEHEIAIQSDEKVENIEAKNILISAKEEASKALKLINSSSYKDINNIRNDLNNKIKNNSINYNNSTIDIIPLDATKIKPGLNVFVSNLNQERYCSF